MGMPPSQATTSSTRNPSRTGAPTVAPAKTPEEGGGRQVDGVRRVQTARTRRTAAAGGARSVDDLAARPAVAQGLRAPRSGSSRPRGRSDVPSRTRGGSCRARSWAGAAGSPRRGWTASRSAGSPTPTGPPRRRRRPAASRARRSRSRRRRASARCPRARPRPSVLHRPGYRGSHFRYQPPSDPPIIACQASTSCTCEPVHMLGRAVVRRPTDAPTEVRGPTSRACRAAPAPRCRPARSPR